MNYPGIREWLRKKRDIIVVALVIMTVLFSIIAGMRMQKNYGVQQRVEEEKSLAPEKVRLIAHEQTGEEGEGTGRKATQSFFLKPSPDEVLSLIKELGDAEMPASNQKYTGLRVMWPAYFFKVLQQESNRATVLLDVSEDGFGVTIQTVVDSTLFPEILSVTPGTKIWVAGELMGVDATGTGTIHMLTEEVRFQEGLMEAIQGAVTAPAATPGAEEPEEPESAAVQSGDATTAVEEKR